MMKHWVVLFALWQLLTPTLAAAKLVFQRDMTLAWRRWDEVAQPLIFYVVVTTMFPLATTPDLSALREIGGGVVWVAALLASLLALEALFRADDMDDPLAGTVERKHRNAGRQTEIDHRRDVAAADRRGGCQQRHQPEARGDTHRHFGPHP